MDKQPIRVLQIIGKFGGGGVESVVLNYYRHIDKSKIQYDFVIHNDSKIDITAEVQSLGGRIYSITPYYKNLFRFMLDIHSILKNNKYKIVHCNMNTISFFALLVAWLDGVPIRILHNHSTSSPNERKRNAIKFFLKPFAKLFANKYFACSRLAAVWMYGKKALIHKKVQIINNAVNLERYRFNPNIRRDLRQNLKIENKFVIGHVGRFMFQKNHEFILKIFYKFYMRHKDSVLILIGDGPLYSEIKQKACKMGLAEAIIFLGLREDVANWYNIMDLFVLPSHYEGLPVVGIEAQANGIPIIVSDKVTKELSITNLIHFESLSENIDSWIRFMEKVYVSKNREHCNTVYDMQKAGFDINTEADKLKKIYLDLEKNLD